MDGGVGVGRGGGGGGWGGGGVVKRVASLVAAEGWVQCLVLGEWKCPSPGLGSRMMIPLVGLSFPCCAMERVKPFCGQCWEALAKW